MAFFMYSLPGKYWVLSAVKGFLSRSLDWQRRKNHDGKLNTSQEPKL
jgi:hypothetical protein